MRFLPVGAFALAMVITATDTAGAGSARQIPDSALDKVLATYAGKGVSDGVVIIAIHGQPVFQRTFGLANREWNVPTTPDARYRIGSLTKQFTAAAILQLVEQGKLRLDDPITNYISDAPDSWRKITIRHLLTHTSGIPNFTEIPEADHWIGRPAEDVIRLVAGRPLLFNPGDRFAYDNMGYVLLGHIVAKASGVPFADYLRAHVLEPAGMTHSGFVGDEVAPKRANGYVRDGQRWLSASWDSGVRSSGAGALYATAGDLLKWDRALHGGKILTPASERLMFTDFGNHYGFGYLVDMEGRHLRWEHNGHVDGYSAALAR